MAVTTRITALVGITLSLATVGAHAQSSQRYALTGERIGIYNLAGRTTVQAGSGSAVVVEMTRGGADAAKLTVDTGQVSDRMTLRVRYPDDHVVYPEARGSNTQISVRDDGTFGGDDEHDGRRFHGGGRNRVTVSGRGSGLEAHADLVVSIPVGAQVAVYVAVGRMTASNVDGRIHLDTGAGPVDATNMKGGLSVDVGSGQVTVRGMTGNLSIDTGSGDVEVSGLKGADLSIDTGSGAVTVADATTTGFKVDTGSGDVDATGVGSESVDIDTGSGRVSLALTTDARSVKIDTGSGNVTLDLPDSFGAAVDIEPGSGGVESDIPIATHRWSSDHVTGTIGDGRGTLRVETGSGGVRLRKTGSTAVRR